MSDSEPSSIRSLAVAAEDVLDAAIYTRENPGTAVLRATPPFHGRMRARLHVFHDPEARVPDAIHVAPADLLEDEVLEAYPTFGEQLEKTDGTDPDRVGERRERELKAWRDRAADAICESVTVEEGHGEGRKHRVDVKRLG
ncbi:hypothetical protein [Halostagnicola sp. A-GB9-2]|uniref:hypothetical protein n=1 Tax=Halostagnicola sp. A-GB9-2 TaxID=3048066 RepID=UPI0024C07243|nr:hypothetical protein [Halostagnicola sp. A-GB9-2]MDJ1433857.1 hypothetical protein [Halostagnicola sp. A-GB9-2]